MSDLIRREDAIEAIEGICNTPCNQYFINAIKKLPTIEELPTAEPKVGRWIKHTKTHDVCSACGEGTQMRYDTGESFRIYHYDYCPNCGAKIRGE